MEKQRIKRLFKSGRRFLITLLLLYQSGAAPVFSQKISSDKIQQLRIVPEEGQKLYTRTDIKFTVIIPDVHSSQVQILSTEQNQDINFRTMRKSENTETKGTSLEIWYNFDKKGIYILRPISLMIQNHLFSIGFNEITITEDPSRMFPRIVIVFEDGTEIYSDEGDYQIPLLKKQTGSKLHFTVNLQYAAQLIQFSWEIPQDSIFTCVKEYEFTEIRYRERIYSHDLIPVADFEWTGLVSGRQKFPVFKLNATGYNGYRNELFLPELEIEFTEGRTLEAEEADTDIFSAAFSRNALENESLNNKKITNEECRTLAALYTKEHKSFLTYSKARKKRIDFESEFSLLNSSNPVFPSVPFYLALIAVSAAIVLLITAHHKKQKMQKLIFTAILLLVFA